jgi:hypothetical protein
MVSVTNREGSLCTTGRVRTIYTLDQQLVKKQALIARQQSHVYDRSNPSKSSPQGAAK